MNWVHKVLPRSNSFHPRSRDELPNQPKNLQVCNDAFLLDVRGQGCSQATSCLGVMGEKEGKGWSMPEDGSTKMEYDMHFVADVMG